MFEQLIPELNAADRKERSRLMEETARIYGCSKDKIYRELKKAGWSSGRKRRCDAGHTEVSEESLRMLAAKLKSGIRSDGRHTVEIPAARWALEQNGFSFGVSNSRLASLLKDRGMDVRSQKAPTSHVRMQTLHPNHVHQVDPSVCLVYYMNGRQRIIEADEVYKNKPYLAGKERFKVWRYVLTDHYSASVCIKYYQSDGEKMTNLWDFLLYAWSPKADPEYLFHGVPKILVWDKGSANTSGAIKIALDALEVMNIPHAKGNPRAKGQVEKTNHLTELVFENHLKDDPAATVEELNAWAENFCAGYNANTLEGYDSTLRRAKTSRLALWSTITRDQLMELPEEARELLVSAPQTRRVGGDLMISYKHPRIKEVCHYRVGGLEGVRPGISVKVQPLMMDASGAVIIRWKYQGEELDIRISPVQFSDAGFPLDSAVFGESFKSNPETYVEQVAKKLDELIGTGKKPFAHLNGGQGLKTISQLSRTKSGVIHMPRTGNVIDPSKASGTVINYVEAANRLKKQMSHWDKAYLKVIKDNFPKGVPERELGSLAEALSSLGGADEFKECIG